MKHRIVFATSIVFLLVSCGQPATSSSASSKQSSGQEETSFSTSEPLSSSESSSSSSSSSFTVSSSGSSDPTRDLSGALVTKLAFDDATNLAKDSSVRGNDGVAVDGGHLSVEKNAWKGHNALSFTPTGRNTDYIELNHNLSSCEYMSIASWVYMPYGIDTFHNQAPLLSLKTSDGDYLYSSPYDTDCWFGYSLNAKTGNTLKQLTKVPPSTKTHWQNTPVDGTIQSVPGAWHHIVYEFSPSSLSVFYNGTFMYEYEGDYSPFGKSIDEFRLGSSSIGDALDFNGKIADVRVYSACLNEAEIKKEFDFDYNDFLTTDFTFDSSLVDSSRGLVAAANGNVDLVSKDGRNCVYLDGSGNAPSNKSSLTLPNQTLHGHNQITVSTDVYIENTGSLYQRLFEFSIGGARFFSAYVGFASTNNLKIEYAPDGDKERDILLDSSYVVPTDKWINITVTADGERGALYVDGYLIAENDNFQYDPVICYYWPDMHCTIGRTDFYGDAPLKGYYDSFKMYGVALSEKDVMEMNGIIKERDDEKAITAAANNFKIEYENDYKITLPSYADDGVKLTYESLTPESVDDKGNLYPKDGASSGKLRVTFSRGAYSGVKDYDVEIAARKNGEILFDASDLDEVKYDDDSYFDETMLSNIDYMFSLDTERLLYNYRLNSKLDTKGATSYGGWIDTHTGGAGQFESQYVGALARYCLSKPDYVSKTAPEATNTPLKRIRYMLNEMRKCQVAYGELYPMEEGFLCAFTHLCMEAIENGSSTVDGGDGIHGTVPIGGVNAWVPFYMYHKNLMMCYDVYQYAPDDEVKSLAYTMLNDACMWTYNELSGLTSAQRSNVLAVEYGGMGEVMYLAYGVTKDYRFLSIAHFFEEEALLNDLLNNRNTLGHRHCNTTLPKVLACCAAYEVLGQSCYRTMAENAWNMIVNDMTYANGGVSLDECFEQPGVTSQGEYGEETCCAYNMLRITDYLYRWSGESKYFDYFENAFYNQIMASIDPATGGKTYPISTTFGYHKIYSSSINSFWCCCCTGQESFSKLNWGSFYKERGSNAITVNLYSPAVYDDGETSIGISGNLFTDEMVHLSVKSSKKFALRLRVPSWCDDMTLKLNGNPIEGKEEGGYLVIEREWAETDDLLIKLPMDYRLEEEKGYEGNYALFYGPLMLVANLGEADPSKCIHANQTADGTYGGQYSGSLTKFMYLSDGIENYRSHITRTVAAGKAKFSFKAENQTVEFIPFMDCIYNYFSMYMRYVFNSKPIVIEGERTDFNLGDPTKFTTYKSNSECSSIFSSTGLSLTGGEQKVMVNGLTLTGDYEVGFTVAPKSGNSEVNTGLYLGASNVGSGQDAINALNVHVEKAANSSSWSICLFKFAQGYLGYEQKTSVTSYGSLSLRVIVKDGTLYIFAEGASYPLTSLKIASSWTDGQIGIRNQGAAATVVSNFYCIH